MRTGITYHELISKEAFIIKAKSTVNGKIYERFSQPYFAREEAEKELQQLQKRFRSHKLWIATMKL